MRRMFIIICLVSSCTTVEPFSCKVVQEFEDGYISLCTDGGVRYEWYP
jgi:hypothetical protein